MFISGAIIYVWYSIVSLYRQMKAEEEANTGVQMAYVDETTNQRNQLPPYNVLTIDKWIADNNNRQTTLELNMIKKNQFQFL